MVRAAAPLQASLRLDRVADVAEDLADPAAKEDEGKDRHDRDEGEDQRVLGKPLAFLVATERSDESMKETHVCVTSFPRESPTHGWISQGRSFRLGRVGRVF